MNYSGIKNDKKKNQYNTDFNYILHSYIDSFIHIGQGVVRRPRPESCVFRIGSFFGLFVFFY